MLTQGNKCEEQELLLTLLQEEQFERENKIHHHSISPLFCLMSICKDFHANVFSLAEVTSDTRSIRDGLSIHCHAACGI